MKSIYCFGDSWGAGAELKYGEHPFIHWVADSLKCPYINVSKQGNSLGIILHSIVSNISNISESDLVLIIIPPDVRWYDQSKVEGFFTVMEYQHTDYYKFLNRKTLEWFKYHHAVFVYTIQKILNDIGCKYIMAHNYGQIDEYKKYNLNIDFNKFLSNLDLAHLLSENGKIWRSYPDDLQGDIEFSKPGVENFIQDGPPPFSFTGKYFKGCACHPNELGHKRIAELILEKINSDK